MVAVQDAEQHHEVVDVTTSRRPKVLMVVANPTVSTTTGWPVGFWAAELTHPYHEFKRVRYDVTLASPEGGKVELDALSDPRDKSKWSAEYLISMGFLNTPDLVALLEDTPKLSGLETVTGFANVEEDYSDKAVGQKVMPYRIEDELRKRGANYIQAGLFKDFAVRDGRLITGQQQYSGTKVAEYTIIRPLRE
jgi:putative intracellular protease/amidase